MIIGHQAQKQYFQDALAADTLAQGYLFIGEEHLGKATFAQHIALALIKDPKKIFENEFSREEETLLHKHPDIVILSEEEAPTIEWVRNLKQRLATTSTQGVKIIIVEKAERFNAESGNAFLKILEEPAGKTHFFFTTSQEGTVLPTLRSRLTPIYFQALPTPEIANHFIQSGFSDKNAKRIALLSQGRVGEALKIFADKTHAQQYEKNLQRLQFYLSSPLWQRMAGAAEDAKDSDTVPSLLLSWLYALQFEVNEKFSGPLSKYKKFLPSILERTLATYQRVTRTNINKKIALEELVLHF